MDKENSDLIKKVMDEFVIENPIFKQSFEDNEEIMITTLQQFPIDEIDRWLPIIVGAAIGVNLLINIIKNR